MDETDLAILRILQREGRASQADIGRRVGLAAPSVNERLRRLERAGVIRGYAARLDDDQMGYDITAFIEVFIDHPSDEKSFLAQVTALHEVLECHYITGEASLLLKVKTTDRAALQRILLERINGLKGVRGTKTVIALSTAKEESALPLGDGPVDNPKKKRARTAP